MVMALLLVVRVWLPPTFSGIDPERRIAETYQVGKEKVTMNGH